MSWESVGLHPLGLRCLKVVFSSLSGHLPLFGRRAEEVDALYSCTQQLFPLVKISGYVVAVMVHCFDATVAI